MNHPDLARAHMAMRSAEAKSFRSALPHPRQGRTPGAGPVGIRRLSRIGRKPVQVPAAS